MNFLPVKALNGVYSVTMLTLSLCLLSCCATTSGDVSSNSCLHRVRQVTPLDLPLSEICAKHCAFCNNKPVPYMRKNVGRNLGALGHSIKARESLAESVNGLPLPTLTEARVSPSRP